MTVHRVCSERNKMHGNLNVLHSVDVVRYGRTVLDSQYCSCTVHIVSVLEEIAFLKQTLKFDICNLTRGLLMFSENKRFRDYSIHFRCLNTSMSNKNWIYMFLVIKFPFADQKSPEQPLLNQMPVVGVINTMQAQPNIFEIHLGRRSQYVRRLNIQLQICVDEAIRALRPQCQRKRKCAKRLAPRKSQCLSSL